MTDETDEESEEETEDKPTNIFIVPTSHASEKSSDQVRDAVDLYNPDLIAIELDQKRLQRLKTENTDREDDDRDKDDDSGIRDLIGNTKNVGLKGRIVLVLFSMMQSNIAEKLGIDLLGLDMMAGYEASVEEDIPLALVDMDMNKTFNRFSEEVSTREALGSVLKFMVAYIQISRMSEEDVDESLGKDAEEIDIEEAMEAMEEAFPTFKKVLIDERNQYIAQATHEAAEQIGDTVLVIGAAHKKGVKEILAKKENLNVHDTTADVPESLEE